MAVSPPHLPQGVRPAGLLSFPRPVWLLGWVSFCTDVASEIIYPLLPLFLARVLGAGALSLGIIEGVAEASNSVLKVISGQVSDRFNRRKPLVLAGYGLSSVVRPLMAIAGSWPQVLVLRFVDRMGKGIRGAPRDAILAHFADERTRGRVFGFHRAMDHLGAVCGPLLASLFLFVYPEAYRALFALTIVPGIIVIFLLLWLPKDEASSPEPPAARGRDDAPARSAGVLAEWRQLPRRFYGVLGVLLLFTLGNSADAFLLLRLGDIGVAPALIPLLWSALHIVKSSSSLFGGALSDTFGRRGLIAAGWLVYALVYAGFAAFDTPAATIALFLAYGLYFGLSEGAEKALVADYAPASARGTAFGIYTAALGVGGLLASVGFGLIWTVWSPPAAFAVGASLALMASALLFVAVPSRP
jgi:MFS family permease